MSDIIELTEEEETALDLALRDPSTIATHDRAVEIIDILDHEIASIDAALEACRMEAACAPLPEHRLIWLRKASYAGAMKRSQRHRVMQRDKEIRGTKGPHPVRKDPGEGLAKQERLREEAALVRARKMELVAASNAAIASATAERDWRKHFVMIAKDVLDSDVFSSIERESHRRQSKLSAAEERRQ